MSGHLIPTKCRSCDQYIVFLKTAKGSNMPVDAESVTEGDEEFDPKVHVSHFSTCPEADKFRREK